MGLRPKPLFWAARIEEKRQSERDLIGTGGKIDELYKVIEFRPNIKVMKYLPAADEMDAIKNENIYDGFLIIFDTMPDDVTDLKEVIRLRPRLKSSSGKNPSRDSIIELLHDRSYDGWLHTFKRLKKAEREYLYGKKE